MTRQVIEDHIRVNLREIAEAFTLCQTYLSGLTEREDMEWLRDEAEYLSILADQLADFRKQLLSLAWRGLTLLFGSALLEVAGPSDQTKNVDFIFNNLVAITQTLLLTFGMALLLGSFLVMGLGIFIMNVKRSYLQPGFNEYGQPRGFLLTSEMPKDFNIYRLENDFYVLLERKKPPEASWDIWGLIAFLVVFSGFLMVTVYWLASIAPDQYITWTWVVGIIVIVMLANMIFQEIGNRLKRDR